MACVPFEISLTSKLDEELSAISFATPDIQKL